MRDVMVDLETLGQRPGCAILSIGAIAFDPDTGALGDTFYGVISREGCRTWKLDEDPDTLAWWGRQSPEARAVLAQAEGPDAAPLRPTLQIFGDYLRRNGGKGVRVWGNGADFDNAILAHLYHVVREPLPWDFWNNRCFRTLKNLAPHVGTERSGTHHNALDDARTQAVHACRILAELKRPPETTVELLIDAERFISGFEGDDSQTGVAELLRRIRQPIGQSEARAR